MKIRFYFNKSVEENASLYYEKAKKIENLIKGEEYKLKLIKEEIEKLKKTKKIEEKRKEEIKKFKSLIKKREWFEKFRYFFSSENELVVCGKDATTNEILIKKYSNKFKWVLHSELSGSPFCLTNGNEKTLKEAADFIACFSKAWKNNLTAIDVFYVKPEQVSKKAKSGEFLTKGSFMIYGQKNFLVGEAKYAIGIKINKEKKIIEDIIFGPYLTVKEKADYWVCLVPGKKKNKELAKEISKKLKIKHWQVLQDLIPPGGGEIAKNLSRTP
jgi:predicted ribosome quality control (RQC) complex YloA/Tae2 family protein